MAGRSAGYPGRTGPASGTGFLPLLPGAGAVSGEPPGWGPGRVRARAKPGVIGACAQAPAATTCFCVRKSFRGWGITYPLARAAADYARQQGASAVEGYAMVTQPGVEITWGEVHVGAVQVFAEAGFTEVSTPTKRRRVMRIDF